MGGQANAVLERVAQLVAADRERLQLPEDVREPGRTYSTFSSSMRRSTSCALATLSSVVAI
jgi:hypothetical protein